MKMIHRQFCLGALLVNTAAVAACGLAQYEPQRKIP